MAGQLPCLLGVEMIRSQRNLSITIEEMQEKNMFYCVNNPNINRVEKGKEKLKGMLFNIPIINILGSAGRDLASGGSITFDVIDGHIYCETLNNTKFTASGSSHTLTNSEPETTQGVTWTSIATTNLARSTYALPTKDVMVIDLTSIGYLPDANCYGAAKAENISDDILFLLVGVYHDGFEVTNEIKIENNVTYSVSWDSTPTTNLTRS